MATLHGYVGDFQMISDATNTSDITAEVTGAADGGTTSFFTSLSDVDTEGFTVTISDTVSDVTQRRGADYYVRGTGEIVFGTAPASGNVKATYTAFKGGTYITAGGFTGWSLDLEVNMPETTDFDNTGWRTFKSAGLKSWTCSAERHWFNQITIPNVGERVLVRMYLDETNSDFWYGWATLTGSSTNAPVGELIDESLTFQGTELLTSVG